MIDVSVLNQNLNDQVSYEDFFKALGYTVNDTIYIRRFDDTKKSSAAQNMQAPFHRFKNMLSSLHFFNEQRQGIYFVVNGGGQGDKDVKVARAAFMEIDDRSFEEQLEIINSFPLVPSAIIKTKKSLHCYWFTPDGDIKLFREIQMRLIQFFSGDLVIKNESRVMRLYGFNHCKQDPPVMVELIWFDTETRYTQQQLLDVLPEVKSEQIVHTNTKQVAASFAKQKESLEWVRGFFQRQNITVLDERVINEGKIKLSVGCPWCDQHTQENCIGESAVIIRKNGMIGYNCFHSHCDGRGWKEFRAFYEQDNDEDETVNSGDREVEKIGDMQANNSEKKKSIPLRWMNFSGIEQKAVDWLVPEYIPRKGITILGGDGGVGKSSIECALAAAVSVGRQTFLTEGLIPEDFGERRPGKVILLNAEDPYSEVLKPLLTAYDADQNNIIVLDERQIKESGIAFSDEQLKSDIVKFKPDLIIFDPLQAFLPDKVKMAERNAMRREVNHALALAEACDCAVLIVMHTNKQQKVAGRQRLADSADVWDIARSVLMAGVCQDGSRYISHEKSNFGKLQGCILFQFDDERKIEILERNTKRDRDFVFEDVDARKNGTSATEEAKEHIFDYLKDEGEAKIKDLDNAMKDLGISSKALRTAKNALKRDGFMGYRRSSNGKSKGVDWYVSLNASLTNQNI